MSDSDDSGSTPGIPSWQRDQKKEPELEPETTTSQDAKQDDVPSREDSLEVARKFLQDDEIKDAPREAKESFLKTKGISPEDIEQLLGSSASKPAQETAQTAQSPLSSSQVTTSSPASANTTPIQTPSTPSPSPSPQQNEISFPRQTDQPPVITYPEFLTKPTRPPPLVTVNGILNTLYAFAGISTLLYGTSKYLVQPMVENLIEARYDLHETTSQNLAKIIEKLEGTVSEIPAPKKSAAAEGAGAYKDAADDDASSADDPTEMFHRDIGTQTSIPSTPSLTTWGENKNSSSDKEKSATDRQADKLTWFKNQAAWLKTTVAADADDVADLKSKMDVLKDDLVQLAYPSPSDYAGSSYSLYGGPRKNEPEDEIKKARDNIRRVKGVLLSTRNFPASAR
ncbi:peroxisomal membrane anchor protein conserved region-domain-containing protein [Colletotrichum acutatum]|uniref:Peroxisomal membrane protein PEX14 n=1 Tax=Glomerella acutata TaxID=27357 RepID=A0AAD8URK3_GLOAC|nr:peroxisomal membrane anchor protein conserved region-domain-containing protein [Colletotrichum acutatum]KAK1728178.1 peroxisomal membrane anchor protein conserved region-domain-containing protein [Colletotrichum acutatum]